MNELVRKFERMLERGRDSALLRYSLGNELCKLHSYRKAAEHLAQAVALDPKYSAAWKLYAKALVGDGQSDAAMAAYRTGIEVATERGDLQAAKEMGVFLRRLEKAAAKG